MLVRSDPRDVPRIIALARELSEDDSEPVVGGGLQHLVAIPLAAGVLAARGSFSRRRWARC